MCAGKIVLREEEIAPTGVKLEFPPESVAVVFDAASNKIVKLVGGGMTVIDRTVGNTAGLGGEQAACPLTALPASPPVSPSYRTVRPGTC